MEVKMKFKCNICNYEWESRVEKPAQCPRCKRYDWNKKPSSNGSGSSNDSIPTKKVDEEGRVR